MIVFKPKKNNHCDRKYNVRKNSVRSTGNKWANENFNLLNKRY